MCITSTAELVNWFLRDRNKYSHRFLEKATDDIIQASIEKMTPINLLNDIPSAERPGRFIACPNPLFARSPRKSHNIEAMQGLIGRVAALMERNFTARGCTFLPQPAHTIEQGIYTQRDYSSSSVRLLENTPHEEDDVTHMNAAFGALALQAVFGTLLGSVPAIAPAECA